MKVVLAADHAGLFLKEALIKHLAEKKITYDDFGTYTEKAVDYPDLAHQTALAVKRGEFQKGILICGTGIGMAISANKVSGIRAAQCSDCFSARAARAHNDANILTLGSRVIGEGLAFIIVDYFLNTPFEGGRHVARLEKISLLEEK